MNKTNLFPILTTPVERSWIKSAGLNTNNPGIIPQSCQEKGTGNCCPFFSEAES
jgi:hypothetical protein